jgi:hypothetical protein
MTDTAGSCACGTITYRFSKRPLAVLNCHCSLCRKTNGSAFSTYVSVRESSFTITQGEEDLQRFAISENVAKHFCSRCGTPLFNQNQRYPGLCIIHYGSLERPEQLDPTTNIYYADKCPWVAALDQLKNYSEGLPQNRR